MDEEEELSDEQVQQLLKDAEERLRASKGKNGTKDTFSSTSLPQIASKNTITPFVQSTKLGAQVDPSMLIKPEDRKLASGFRTVEDPLKVKAKAVESAKATAGSDWFNLPRTNLTPELKRDLQLLKMRSVLDPKRFYKKDNSKLQIPEYSQVGTIIEGPTEYFTSRLTNKERKRTLVEEVLHGEQGTKRFKSKFAEIQKAKQSGGKGQYNKLRAQRRKSKT